MSEKGPTSEDLNRTVDLLAGLGDERPETGEFFSGPASPDRGHRHMDCDLGPDVLEPYLWLFVHVETELNCFQQHLAVNMT